MTTPDEFLALADRAEAGTGSGWDADLAMEVLNAIGRRARYTPANGHKLWAPDTGRWMHMPRIDYSLDAITTLIEEELPEWDRTNGKTWFGSHWARLEDGPKCASSSHDHSDARALLAAFLRAMAVEMKSGGE